MELELGLRELPGAHKPARRAPYACGALVAPLWYFSVPVFLYILEIISVKFQLSPRTFISAQKEHHGNSAENNISLG